MNKKIDFFILGLIFIPFDNLFFAPSSGWATIAPFFFLAYLITGFNGIRKVISRCGTFFPILLLFGIYQCCLWLYNGLNFSAAIDELGTLFLGIIFFLSLVLRYEVRNYDADVDARYLYKSYCISFAYGIIRFLALNYIEWLNNVFMLIEKRTYNRLTFSFTEPSFISVHILGVLFLWVYLVRDAKLANKMIRLGMLFLVLSTVFKSSSRCVIDFAIFIGFTLVYLLFRDAKHFARNFLLILICIILVVIMISVSPRVLRVLSNGFYADASMASRFFRIVAMLAGFKENIVNSLVGYGIGNMDIPFNNGYTYAYEHFTNAYVSEILALKDTSELTTVFCLPLKIMSAFGIIPFFIGMVSLFYKCLKNHIDLLCILLVIWVYIQFDSYAFYALWILFYLAKFGNHNNESVFGRIKNILCIIT